MLEIQNQEYFGKVMEFAKQTKQEHKLQDMLNYLATYACRSEDNCDLTKTKCILYKDFAPYSFEFVMLKKNNDGEYKRWFNGGLIYHGQHDNYGDGGSPTFSVCVNPVNGWSIHT